MVKAKALQRRYSLPEYMTVRSSIQKIRLEQLLQSQNV